MRAKITKRSVDALRPTEDGREKVLWDAEPKGFGARVQRGSVKSYILHYRIGAGRGAPLRKLTIGKHGSPWTPETARAEAKRLLAIVAQGKDPAAAKSEALTVGQLCERYLEAAHAGLVLTRFKRPKRLTTVAIDEGRVSRHIKPLIGKIPARDLRRADVQRMADAIAQGKTAGTFKGQPRDRAIATGSPPDASVTIDPSVKPRGRAIVTGGAGTAARVVELLGGIYSWAEKRELVTGPNPAHGIETARGEAKDRVLSSDELRALRTALDKNEAKLPMAVAAVLLIALTGLRREEACALRWSEIDFPGSCLRLEATKTGRSTRPIGKAARDLLQSLPRLSDEWVFPNRNGTGRAELKASIADLFDAARLKDARSHDLRRTFGSVAADEGYGDATIAELLGHSRRGVTQRHYIRRPDAALVAAADRVSAWIVAALDGRKGFAEVVPLRSGA
jgi:integrase-like protein/Arm domain-containing DNA-binding protein